ncbi:hypothetical protein LCGC14_1013710 [marine sediment metagenome]|uniref:Uncharacterized protein n=1 Tax=marine sediment metagenome TaxID=412755 RepID=A0A0F9R5J2_9ZZZZ
MIDSYDFSRQMEIGREGVEQVRELLLDRYEWVNNYEKAAEMQRRGIDLEVCDLGYVEVKTDLHTTKNFFFELSANAGPGGLDKSAADYFAFLFPNEGKMFLIPRPELIFWLRRWATYMINQNPDCLKLVSSHRGDAVWAVSGIVVPWQDILGSLKVITVTFADLSDGSVSLWEGEE